MRYHIFWGAIGDLYFYLTCIRPEIEAHPDDQHVLRAYTYLDRYSEDTILELCRMTGLFDIVMVLPRETAGIVCAPTGETVYRPNIAQKDTDWDKYVTAEYATPDRDNWIFIPESAFVSKETLQMMYNLPDFWVTCQTDTPGKHGHVFDADKLIGNRGFGCAVEMHSKTSKSMRTLKIPELPISHTLSIIRHADAHFGVESSQMMAAGLLRKHCYYLPYLIGPGLRHYTSVLNLEQYWHPFGVTE